MCLGLCGALALIWFLSALTFLSGPTLLAEEGSGEATLHKDQWEDLVENQGVICKDYSFTNDEEKGSNSVQKIRYKFKGDSDWRYSTLEPEETKNISCYIVDVDAQETVVPLSHIVWTYIFIVI